MKKLITALALLLSLNAQAFKVGGMNWISSDAPANSVLKTDGAGNLGWIDLTATARQAFLFSAPLTYNSTTGSVGLPQATSLVNGFLASTDWAIFNAKQPAANYLTALTGDVTATGPGSVPATVVTVGTSTAALVHSAELAASAATDLNTASTIVKRDGSGGFTAGTVTAALAGNATTATNAASFTGALSGQVTGTQSATVISAATVTGKALTGYSPAAGAITAVDSILTAIGKNDANVALRAPLASPTLTGTVTAPTFAGALTGNASTASALASTPTACGANSFATGIAASGNLTCVAVPDAALGTSYLKADGSRTLTGAQNFTQIATPGAPAASTTNLYSKSDGKLYYFPNGGSETVVGAGAGGGGGGLINYLPSLSIDAESSVHAWSWLTRTATLPLSGAQSYLFTSSGAGTTAELPFTIDRSALSKVLQVSFDYEIASGTFTDGALEVWIYDVTAGAVVGQLAPYKVLNSVGPQKWTGTFQSHYANTSYKLQLGQPSLGVWSTKLDNFRVGPVASVNSGVSRAPTMQSFSVVGSGTYTTPSGVLYLRVKILGGGGGGSGGSSQATGNGGAGGAGGTSSFGGSSAGGGAGAIALDKGMGGMYGPISSGLNASIGVSGGDGSTGQQAPSTFNSSGTGGSSYFGGNGGNSLNGGGGYGKSSSGGGGGGGGAAPPAQLGASGGAGSYLEGTISGINILPTFSYTTGAGGTAGSAGTSGNPGGQGGSGLVIVEEYYNVSGQSAADAGSGRRIAFRADRNGVAVSLPINGTFVKVPFNSVSSTLSKDDAGSYDVPNSRYVVSTPGRFNLGATILVLSPNVLANRYALLMYKNGAEISRGTDTVPAAGTNLSMQVFGTVDGVIGDYFEIWIYGGGNNSVNQLGIDPLPTVSHFDGFLIQGPAQVLPTESVNVSASTAAGQAIGTGWTNVVFGTVDYSSHGTAAYNPATGVFTAPCAGKFRFSMVMQTATVTLSTTQALEAAVWKNGTGYRNYPRIPGNGALTYQPAGGSITVPLLAGETANIASFCSVATTLITNSAANHLEIEKVGN